MNEMKKIVLFDGDCGFCNQSVQFILERDPQENFVFASLEGKIGQQLLKQYGLNTNINSLVLVDNKRVYIKSSAVLQICKNLKGPWKWLHVFNLVPGVFRDLLYDLIAVNRYKWFGKNDKCLLPKPHWSHRFLD